jgi:dephospho-CoA kinase
MNQVVAVTGGMASGKSTVVERLESLLPRAVAVHEDSMTEP